MTSALTRDEAQQAVELVNEALRAGFRPPGKGGYGLRAIMEAERLAVARGIVGTANAFRSRLKIARDAFGLTPDYGLYEEKKAKVGKPKDVGKDKLEELKGRIRVLEREWKEKDDLLKRQDKIISQLEALGERSLAPVQFSPKLHGSSSPGTPMMIWSDWHWGEVVDKGELGGVNEFNLSIAHERLDRLVDRSMDLIFNHMTSPQYEGLVICLGGDMISGDIHEELAISNEAHVAEILEDLDDHLVGALEAVGKRFDRILVPCVVGNHGRMSKKPRFKGRTGTNHEYNTYVRLKKHFERKGDKRFKFLIPRRADVHFRVYKWRFLLTHGDSLGVKGGDGIIGNLGPLMRGRIKIGGAEGKIGQDFDILVCGHWHDCLVLPEKGLVVNGSLKGFDEYAHLALRASFQRPIQALWFCHPVHGITARWPIILEDDLMALAQADLPWTSWKESP